MFFFGTFVGFGRSPVGDERPPAVRGALARECGAQDAQVSNFLLLFLNLSMEFG